MTRSFTASPASELDMVFSLRTVSYEAFPTANASLKLADSASSMISMIVPAFIGGTPKAIQISYFNHMIIHGGAGYPTYLMHACLRCFNAFLLK